MRIHELIPYEGLNLVIHNEETGNTVVLTSAGAVYDSENTEDLTNLSVAFGALFTSDRWRIATTQEVEALRKRGPADKLLQLTWCEPTTFNRLKLASTNHTLLTPTK